jgi:hypothetical protein
MAYDYKPGEEEDVLKRYLVVATVVVLVAFGLVLTMYLGLGINSEMLRILMKRFIPDAGNVIFVITFVTAGFALWGLFREPAAAEGVNRRQAYFVALLVLAGIISAGTVYYKYFVMPTHGEVTKTEACSSCSGTGRARYRPEYPCGACDGTGYITP